MIPSALFAITRRTDSIKKRSKSKLAYLNLNKTIVTEDVLNAQREKGPVKRQPCSIVGIDCPGQRTYVDMVSHIKTYAVIQIQFHSHLFWNNSFNNYWIRQKSTAY